MKKIQTLSFTMNFARKASITRQFSVISQLIDSKAQKYPTKDVLNFVSEVKGDSHKWNSQQFKLHVDAVASGMKFIGLTNVNICSFLPLGAEQVALGLASVLCGNNFIQVSNSVTESDIKKILKSSTCTAVYIPGTFESVTCTSATFPELNAMAPYDTVVKIAELPSLKFVVHTGLSNERGMNRYRDLLTYFAPENTGLKLREGKFSLIDGSGKKSGDYTMAELITLGNKIGDEIGIKTDSTGVYTIKSNAGNLDVIAGAAASLQRSGVLVVKN